MGYYDFCHKKTSERGIASSCEEVEVSLALVLREVLTGCFIPLICRLNLSVKIPLALSGTDLVPSPPPARKENLQPTPAVSHPRG